ncbi:MAG: hypothetical protein ICV54_24390 [Nostoc sp. C3-bin3]|nr:hypothetical protein [Nostoc sp. C3-bin3]
MLISPLKLQPKDIGCQIAKVVQGIIPYSGSRSVNNFSSTTVRFGRFSFPNNCNRLLTVSSNESEYILAMRSPTVGGYAITNHPHLLTLRRQVFVRFQMLQPNRVFAIPHPHLATELIYLADNPPAATLAPEFWIIFG